MAHGIPANFSGHIIGLLKAYMRDLVDQAEQESHSHQQFGFTSYPYRPDQAVSDLLALLDDRIESEGIQVGLPDNFLHDMWDLCNEALSPIRTVCGWRQIWVARVQVRQK